MADAFTPTQRCMLDVLADGMPHTRQELFACLQDDLSPLRNIRAHITFLRKKLAPHGQNIICELYAGKVCYRHVRLLAWREEPDTVLMPGGESLRQVLDRSWRGLARAADGLGKDDTLLVVAHDAANRVLLCRVLGLPIARLWTFRQAPTTLNLLEGPSVEQLEVVRLNDCAHHTPFFGEAKHRAL